MPIERKELQQRRRSQLRVLREIGDDGVERRLLFQGVFQKLLAEGRGEEKEQRERDQCHLKGTNVIEFRFSSQAGHTRMNDDDWKRKVT